MSARLWPYAVGSAVLGLDAYVIAGLLPRIAQDVGSTAGAVGMGVAAFTGAYAISGPLLAGVAGRRAARSLLLALGVFVVANIGSAQASSVRFFIVTRLLAGAAAGVYSPLSSSVAAASVRPERVGRALSLVLAGLACGTVFGVPLGLVVAQHTSWRWTFWFIAAVGLVAAGGVAWQARDGIPTVDAPALSSRLRTLRSAPNVLTMTVTLLTGIASLGLYTYVVPWLSDAGRLSEQTWLIWLWGLGGALGALVVGRIVDATHRPQALTVLIAAGLTGVFLMLAVGTSLVVVALGVFAWGFLGWASLTPQQHTLMTANPHDGTTAIAANASANYLGSALGSVGGAALLDGGTSGADLPYFAAGCVALAGITQVVRNRLVRHRRPGPDCAGGSWGW